MKKSNSTSNLFSPVVKFSCVWMVFVSSEGGGDEKSSGFDLPPPTLRVAPLPTN